VNENARLAKNPGVLVPDATGNTVVNVPNPDDALRIASCLSIHTGWSIFWDKRYGVWRVSEDDPSSGLYEENTDARTVIAYVAAHS
jgi:hypothetical protein